MLKLAADLELPREVAGETLAILAKKGSGKTYTGGVLAEELVPAGIPVTIIDPVSAWWGIRIGANLPFIIFGGDHADVPIAPEMGAIVADYVVDNRACAVLDIGAFTYADQRRFVDGFTSRLYHRNRLPMHLIIDEADEFAPQSAGAGGGMGAAQDRIHLLGSMERLVRRGRGRGIGVTMISQRGAVLNKNVLEQVDTLIIMHLTGPNDIDAVDRWIKRNASAERRTEVLNSLSRLKKGQAWVWSPGRDVLQLVKIREKQTFDSSSTPTLADLDALGVPPLEEIDLEGVRAAFAATLEKRMADDPKALKERIRQLEGELKNRPVETVERIVEKIVEVPAIEPEQLEILAQHVANLRDESATLVGRFEGLYVWFSERYSKIYEAIGRLEAPAPPPKIKPGKVTRTATRPANLTPTVVPAEADRADGIGPGMIAILTAIAQTSGGGATREQIGILTGYKKSTRNAYLQRLASRGLVESYDGGMHLSITTEGLTALGPNYEPLPTGDALLQHWLGKLPEGEAAILRVLASAYPKYMERAEFDQRTVYKKSTRNAYIQRLVARRLVSVNPFGHVQAAEELFG